jgi:PST family polysaccharide transporter
MWLASSRILVNLLGLVSTLVLARLLSPGDFGLVALAEAVFVIAGAFTELSLAQSLVQHREPKPHHFDTAFTLNLARSVLLGAGLAALSVPLAAIYGDERLRDVVLVLALATAMGGLENPRLVVFQRKLVFWQDFLLNVGSKLAGLLGALAIAYVYRSYWALVLGSFAAQAIRIALSYAVMPGLPRFALRGTRELLSFSLWLTMSGGLKTATWRFDPLALGLVIPQAGVGHYTFGSRFGGTPVRESLGPLRTLLFPAFSRMQDEPFRLRRAYRLAQAMLFFLAMPLAAGFAFVAEQVVLLAIGEKWLPAVPVIQAIALLSAVNQLENSHPLAMSLGRTKSVFERDARVFAIRLPLVIVGLAVGQATALGALMGVVLGRAAATFVNVGLNMRLVERLIGDTPAEQLRIAARPVVAAAVMTGVLLLLFGGTGAPADTLAMLAELLLVVPLGAAVYFGTAFVLWRIAGRPDGPERELLSGLEAARRRFASR